MSVWHQTRSSVLVTMLNKLGHCISYDTLQRLDTSLAGRALQKYREEGVIIPTNIYPGIFTQVAADNLDLSEETLDGKLTTHSTTVVLSQEVSLISSDDQVSERTPLQREKSTQDKGELYQIQPFYASGRKPEVTEYKGHSITDRIKPIPVEETKLDFSWLLLREKSSGDTDSQRRIIPGWTGFNSMIVEGPAYVTAIGYCPLLPTDYSTVYTVLRTVQNIMEALEQKQSIITFDEAIYCKAKEITWRRPDQFADVILRLGGFHIVLNFLGAMGKAFNGSGLEDLLVESGVYAPNTTAALLKGKMYNRGVRAHKLLLEAMTRLCWQAFTQWRDKKKDDPEVVTAGKCEAEVLVLHRDCMRAFEYGDNADKQRPVNSLCVKVQPLMALMERFKDESRKVSQLFHFWTMYTDMVQILLRFIRAERQGNWELHVQATTDMLPYFFAFDRHNYARWLPVYLADMNLLPKTAPEVHTRFLAGQHVIYRSLRPFAAVSVDRALEQTVNRDAKTSGGIIGKSLNPRSLNRWFITSHERAAITTAMSAICEASGDCNTHLGIMWTLEVSVN